MNDLEDDGLNKSPLIQGPIQSQMVKAIERQIRERCKHERHIGLLSVRQRCDKFLPPICQFIIFMPLTKRRQIEIELSVLKPRLVLCLVY